MKYPPLIARYASIAAIGVLMTACGGGGGATATDTTATPTTVAAASISGSLIDGPIQGAQVFVDLNDDQAHNAGEPISGETDESGHFSIDVSGLTAFELAGASLVSIIPDSAKDLDDGGATLSDAGRTGMTLISPLSAFLTQIDQTTASGTVVSPISTLVSSALSDGMTLAQARAQVKQELGLGANQDPLDQYVAKRDTEMANIARATTHALGEARTLLQDTLTANNETMTTTDAMKTMVGAVRDQMTKALAHTSTRNAIVAPSTKLTPTQVKNLLDQAGNDQDIAQAVNGLPETLSDAVSRRAANAKKQRTNLDSQTYLVIFKSDEVTRGNVGNVGTTANSLTASFRGNSTVKPFTHVFQGFSVTIPSNAAEAFLEAMHNNPNVQSIEADQSLRRHASRPINGTYADGSSYNMWGLNIADGVPTDTNYSYTHTGAGTTAFVVDTGILPTHQEFGSRVIAGTNTVSVGGSSVDDQGHGSHVAGTVGGITFGVSSGVKLVPVKVLDATGSGSLTSVIAGLDWVSKQVTDTPSLLGHAVVNMSLGGGASNSLDLAAANLVKQGIPVVVAAGNSNADACNYSPAREPSVITVGAAAFNGTSSYTRAYYSNFGPCVDVFAPGSVITSAGITSDVATATMSGTSMAAPHVTGWVAQLLDMAVAENSQVASSSDVNGWIAAGAEPNLLTDAGAGSPNLFMKISDLLPTSNSGGGSGGETSSPVSVHVADIQGRSGKAGHGWAAQATITVVDSGATVVSGAQVTGHFTINGSNYNVMCVTADNGSCSVGTGSLPLSITQVSYGPDSIGPVDNFTYVAADNAVSGVTITAPTSSGGGGSTREGKPGRVKR